MCIPAIYPFRIGQTCELCKDDGRCNGDCRDPEHSSNYGDNNPPVREYHEQKYGHHVNEFQTVL